MDKIKQQIILEQQLQQFNINKSVFGTVEYEINQDIQKGLSQSEVIEKARLGIYTSEDISKGGKRAAVGEIRTFGGKEYQKQSNGDWKPVKKGEAGKKEEKEINKKHLESFNNYYDEFDINFNAPNGDPEKDYSNKLKSSIKALFNEDYIVKQIYSNDNGHISLKAYNKKNDSIYSIMSYRLNSTKNGNHYNKITLSVTPFLEWTAGNAGLSESKAKYYSKEIEETYPKGDYTAYIGVSTAGLRSMSSSTIQTFYNNLKELISDNNIKL